MDNEEFVKQIFSTWKRHNDILLFLLAEIPKKGLLAKPAESRGRDVARQFTHMFRARKGWVHYHATGKKPKLKRYDKGEPPTKAHLKKELQASGKEVEGFLKQALTGKASPRLFGKEAIRWMGYLISHESHHRGQIMLALKQSGMRLPERVGIQGLWGKWIYGK